MGNTCQSRVKGSSYKEIKDDGSPFYRGRTVATPTFYTGKCVY